MFSQEKFNEATQCWAKGFKLRPDLKASVMTPLRELFIERGRDRVTTSISSNKVTTNAGNSNIEVQATGVNANYGLNLFAAAINIPRIQSSSSSSGPLFNSSSSSSSTSSSSYLRSSSVVMPVTDENAIIPEINQTNIARSKKTLADDAREVNENGKNSRER